MDKLIGREQEISLLKEYTSADAPEFVAIYGRRRVGKEFPPNAILGEVAIAVPRHKLIWFWSEPTAFSIFSR